MPSCAEHGKSSVSTIAISRKEREVFLVPKADSGIMAMRPSEDHIVLCHDYQKEVMQSVLGDSAEVRATDQTADDKDGSPSS